MEVAPYESCIVCFRGDTTTAIGFRGEAEWCIAGLLRLGVPPDQAEATFLPFAKHELGCDPGTVPDGQIDYAVRLCRACANRVGAHVGDVRDGEIPTYAPLE
jgi:hypothetical protein